MMSQPSTAKSGPGPVIIKIGGSTLESRSAAALWPALVAKLHAERAGGVVLVTPEMLGQRLHYGPV